MFKSKNESRLPAPARNTGMCEDEKDCVNCGAMTIGTTRCHHALCDTCYMVHSQIEGFCPLCYKKLCEDREKCKGLRYDHYCLVYDHIYDNAHEGHKWDLDCAVTHKDVMVYEIQVDKEQEIKIEFPTLNCRIGYESKTGVEWSPFFRQSTCRIPLRDASVRQGIFQYVTVYMQINVGAIRNTHDWIRFTEPLSLHGIISLKRREPIEICNVYKKIRLCEQPISTLFRAQAQTIHQAVVIKNPIIRSEYYVQTISVDELPLILNRLPFESVAMQQMIKNVTAIKIAICSDNLPLDHNIFQNNQEIVINDLQDKKCVAMIKKTHTNIALVLLAGIHLVDVINIPVKETMDFSFSIVKNTFNMIVIPAEQYEELDSSIKYFIHEDQYHKEVGELELNKYYTIGVDDAQYHGYDLQSGMQLILYDGEESTPEYKYESSQGYVFNQSLGSGANGMVRKGYFSEEVAVKFPFSSKIKSEIDAINLLYSEERIGKLHDHLMIIYNVFKKSIVMEFLPDELKNNVQLAQEMYSLLSALDYLKSRNLCHLDIKPDNIRGRDGIYKLCDFGTMRRPCKAYAIGTLRYMHPNALKNGIFNYESDEWSLMMSYAMLTNPDLYAGTVEYKIMSQIVKQSEPYNLCTPSEERDALLFIEWCKRVRLSWLIE